MKLVVFGATGGSGRQLVEQAVLAGHDVTAFARTPEKLGIQNAKLTVIQGDILDPEAVDKAVQGKDAVLCALGAPAADKGRLREAGTRNIIAAMHKHGVKRLVCQASLGYGDTYDALSPFMKWFIVPFILKDVFADHEAQEALIKKSDLDWIIVRPANLTDGEHTGSYRHGPAATQKGSQMKISRADTAEFMLKQLTEDQYLHQTPGLSY